MGENPSFADILMAKAAKSDNSEHALQFSLAALNVAHVIAELKAVSLAESGASQRLADG